MKKILTIMAAVGALSTTGQNFSWAAPTGTQGDLWPWDITVDPSGNAISCGTFGGNPDFDPGPDSLNINAGGSMRGYVRKLDPDGNLVWVRDFPAPPWINMCRGVVTDGIGNVYVAGSFQGTTDLDPGPGTYMVSGGNPSYADVYVLKLSAQGNLLWAKHFEADPQSHDVINTLDMDVNGQYIFVGGATQGTIDADPSTSGTVVLDCDSTHGFIIKLDLSGHFVWGKTLGGLSGCSINAISTDVNGNVYSTGMLLGPYNDFDPGPALHLFNNTSAGDLFVSKLSSSGNFVWARLISGYNNQWANDMIIDGGDLYLTGMFADTTDFDPGPGTHTLTTYSNFGYGCDAFLLRLDTTGAFHWVRGFGDYGDEHGTALVKTQAGDLFCAGNYSGSPVTDFDPGPGTFTLGWDYGSSIHHDIFVARFDGSGNFTSAGRIGNIYADEAQGLATDAYNNVYLAARYQRTVDMDPGAGTHTVAGGNNYQSVVIKFSDPCQAPGAPIMLTPSGVSLCAGAVAGFKASASSYVVWYDAPAGGSAVASGTVFSPGVLSTGSYTWYAGANTCTPSAQRTAVTVSVTAFPQLTVSATSSLICAGESVTITAAGAYSYEWDDNNTQPFLVAGPLSTTVYSVTGTQGPGCSASSMFTVEVDECLGVEALGEEAMSLWPNPVSAELHVASVEDANLILYDTEGKLVLAAKLSAGENLVHLDHLQPGIYFAGSGGRRWKVVVCRRD